MCIAQPESNPNGEPYQHTTIDSRNHHSITSNVSDWKELQPDLAYTCPDYRTYLHSLVSTFPHRTIAVQQ